jgi:hypothetical protein
LFLLVWVGLETCRVHCHDQHLEECRMW